MLPVLAGILLFLGAAAPAGPLQVRLVPIKEALKKYPDGTDPRVTTVAKKAGIDLSRPSNPLLACSYRDNRLFYVFYNDVRNPTGPHEYLIQRIRKEQRSWKSARDRKPETQQSFLVEAFRLRDGAFVGSDRHHASFGLGSHHSREIRKEFEIGFGQLDKVAQGKDWPFDKKKRYHKIQEYGPRRGVFDEVKFSRSVKWTLVVTFDRDGKWAVRCAELGFDAPRKMPRP
jgi:hypothetical protein